MSYYKYDYNLNLILKLARFKNITIRLFIVYDTIKWEYRNATLDSISAIIKPKYINLRGTIWVMKMLGYMII